MFILDWASICRKLRVPLAIERINAIGIDDITKEFSELFKNELGTVQFCKAHIELRPGATPKFYKPRPVPFALKEKVEKDLQRLQDLGVIEPIMRSDWAAPLVVAPKPNGNVRLCGDFNFTLNQQIQADWYPVPSARELFASLSGCTHFSKVDLKDAYFQVQLEEAAQEMCVINTHK